MSDINKTLEQSFLDYAAFVLQRRSTPDSRDCMKYTARQIVHAMYHDNLDFKHPFKKSQKSVAAATSFSYCHGDSSAYETIIHLGRNLITRYKFIDSVGNFGTMCSSNGYAASRYTECRLSELGTSAFNYLNENTLTQTDWAPTYDDADYFPLVLPSVGYYNICNGCFGIGVGTVSSIPQFNLKEINDAICELIDNPNYEPIIYPDFACGGILLNPKTTLISLNKGEGKSCLVRGEIRRCEKEGYLEIISLPPNVYTETICKEIEEAYNKGITIFNNFKDLTKQSVQIRIYGNNLDELEDWIYKNTSVQKHFTIKMTMLDKGKVPKIFSLKEALSSHITHVKKIYHRHFEYQLNTLKARQEILDGLIRAYSILDDIISLIKKSNGRADAIVQLRNLYNFTARQSEAIVDLRLHRLSNMDIQQLRNELENNLKEQERLNHILNTESEFNSLLKQEYKAIADKYGDERRTKIYEIDDRYEVDSDGAKPTKDFYLVGNETCYWASTQENDEVFDSVEIDSQKYKIHIKLEDEIIFITNKGRAIKRIGEEFLMGNIAWDQLMKLEKDEKIIYIKPKISLPSFIIFDTKKLHISYIEIAATQRGKKIIPGQWNLEEIKEV